jgi:DNA-binding transcriptional ArsR family regulator
MTDIGFDPVMHEPARLRIAATLAALPHGDALSVTRLRDLTGLAGRDLTAGLGELGQAGYVRTSPGEGGDATGAIAALTGDGRAALDRYAARLRQARPAPAAPAPAPAAPAPAPAAPAPGPGVRAGDADRDRAAAALAVHYAQGRLTFDEFSARLEATLTAITFGELGQAARDLPDPEQR